MLVDTFPAHFQGPPQTFNGKYKMKVRKYQAITNLRGDLLSVQPCWKWGEPDSEDEGVTRRSQKTKKKEEKKEPKKKAWNIPSVNGNSNDGASV